MQVYDVRTVFHSHNRRSPMDVSSERKRMRGQRANIIQEPSGRSPGEMKAYALGSNFLLRITACHGDCRQINNIRHRMTFLWLESMGTRYQYAHDAPNLRSWQCCSELDPSTSVSDRHYILPMSRQISSKYRHNYYDM